MNIKRFFRILLCFVLVVPSASCKDSGPEDPVLVLSASEIIFSAEGGEFVITMECNDQWSISNPASSWLQLSLTSGNSGTFTIKFTAEDVNETGATRYTVLNVNSQNGQSRRIEVSQTATIYPSYNGSPKAPDATGMNSTAVELASKINLGWNIGNTMEAPGGETGWGNPLITEDYVKFVKYCGFNAIRIPCAWNWYHVDNPATAHINTDWLNRVKEVVGYCIDNDLYVLLNIHWDNGWLENNCTRVKQDSVNARQKAFWEQIATVMRDFDEHLMFASSNEPNTDDAGQMEVLLSYHKAFIDAVRSTGGHNTYRVLVIQGAAELLAVEDFPTDPTPDRIMYETHIYTPYQFTALDEDADWGKMYYYWGAGHHSTIEPGRNAEWGEEEELLEEFEHLKTQFVDKGIPVLLGEYGAYRRGNGANVPKDPETHNASVDYWITYVTHQALAHGVKPFFWDTGNALDRQDNTVLDQRTIDAIIAGRQ